MIRVRSTSAAGIAELGGATLLVPGPRLDIAAGNGITLTQSGSTTTVAASASFSTNTDGWIDDTSETWSYSSSAAFTISGSDLTAKYSKGTKIKLTQTTVKYFYVTSSSFASSTTTVNITGGSDYTLANAAISSNYHSYVLNPQGFPAQFNFAPSWTGFSSIATNIATFSVIPGGCLISMTVSGQSNAASKTFTLPFSCSNDTLFTTGYSGNNGVTQSVPARVETNGTTGTLARTVLGDGWTTSGTAWAYYSVVYPI